MKNINQHQEEIKKKVSKNETAEQSMVRLGKAIDYFRQNERQIVEALKKEYEANDVEFDEERFYTECWSKLEGGITPYCVEEVPEETLNEQEKVFNITLPTAYKEFILKYGYLSFGKEDKTARKMFSLTPILEILPEEMGWDLDYLENQLAKEELYVLQSTAPIYQHELAGNPIIKTLSEAELLRKLGKRAIEKLSNIYAFIFGDAEIYSPYEISYVLFDFNGINNQPETARVIDFRQDDIFYFYVNQSGFDSFDNYMSWAVDKTIDSVFEHHFWNY